MSTFPGIAGEIEGLIGVELTTALLRRRGGCQLSVPRRAKGSLLAEIIGLDAAQQMIDHFGQGRLTLPCSDMRGAKRRRAEAKAMLRQGASLQQVALACDLHTRTVSNYRAEIEAEAGSRQLALPFDSPARNMRA
jgi:hypothetical protein